MVRFYMDVHVPAAITQGLRLRGVDALTAQEDGTSEWAGTRARSAFEQSSATLRYSKARMVSRKPRAQRSRFASEPPPRRGAHISKATQPS